jgi:hypothetical protein
MWWWNWMFDWWWVRGQDEVKRSTFTGRTYVPRPPAPGGCGQSGASIRHTPDTYLIGVDLGSTEDDQTVIDVLCGEEPEETPDQE